MTPQSIIARLPQTNHDKIHFLKMTRGPRVCEHGLSSLAAIHSPLTQKYLSLKTNVGICESSQWMTDNFISLNYWQVIASFTLFVLTSFLYLIDPWIKSSNWFLTHIPSINQLEILLISSNNAEFNQILHNC